mgnify:CR=1 FL=1
MVGHHTSHRAAFTLIEALVVTAIVALLVGVLVPALSITRDAAREAACTAQQRRLHVGTMSWAQSHNDQIPGVNVTGLRYMRNYAAALELLGDTTPTTPTTVFDWISPVMGDEAKLSPNRARRTKQIFEDLGCPGTTRDNDAAWGLSAGDIADFRELMAQEEIRQISYLSPGPFHLLGKPVTSGEWTAPGKKYTWAGPAVTPSSYKPLLYRVGTRMSDKVFLADGTRYLASRDHLDFDAHPNPKYYGSFTSSTPIYTASREYGRAPTTPEFADENHSSGNVHPHNARLSYRHRDKIMVVYFDGHAGSMTQTESRTNAAPWYPGGSVFTGIRATEESLRFHNVSGVTINNPADVKLP